LPSSFIHYLSSGLLGLSVFLLTWIVYGKYLEWRHRSTSHCWKEETFIRHFYLSCMLASLASLLLHLHLDREPFGGVWEYFYLEYTGYPHPYWNQFLIIIVILLFISVYVIRKMERSYSENNTR